MVEEEKIHYFKRNVKHSFSVRFHRGDNVGLVVNQHTPPIEVAAKDIKVFRTVNRGALEAGLLIEIDAPNQELDTKDVLTDEDIPKLLSNWLKLKNTVPTMDSVPMLYKLLGAATEKKSSDKIIQLISDRILEVEPVSIASVDRGEMGVTYEIGEVAPPRA